MNHINGTHAEGTSARRTKGTSRKDAMDGTKSDVACSSINATIKEEGNVRTLSKEPKSLVGSNKPKNNASKRQACAQTIRPIHGKNGDLTSGLSTGLTQILENT